MVKAYRRLFVLTLEGRDADPTATISGLVGSHKPHYSQAHRDIIGAVPAAAASRGPPQAAEAPPPEAAAGSLQNVAAGPNLVLALVLALVPGRFLALPPADERPAPVSPHRRFVK